MKRASESKSLLKHQGRIIAPEISTSDDRLLTLTSWFLKHVNDNKANIKELEIEAKISTFVFPDGNNQPENQLMRLVFAQPYWQILFSALRYGAKGSFYKCESGITVPAA